jgi:hypothetical protein
MTTPEPTLASKLDTLLKIANSLRKVGLTEYQIHRSIMEMQGDGIVFSEKEKS